MTTYTSDELASMVEQLPAKARASGLLFIEEAEFNREPDVVFSGETVTLDTALAIAVQAPFVSLQVEKFDGEQLADELKDEDGHIPEELASVISAARLHEGEVEEVTIHWTAQGMIFEWSAFADWHPGFWETLAHAKAMVDLQEHQEVHDEWAMQLAQMKELADRLAGSQEFRFAKPRSRRAIAETMAVKIAGDVTGSGDFSRILREAGALVDRNVLEHEQRLRPQIRELAAELLARPEWRTASNQAKMRDAVTKFLAKKAEGYRLSAAFVEEVMQAALNYR
ncbi:hypothetical protein [Pseudarthrobacter sp. fls2-241-R2A-168]|uniref:hypothetical protein n=1 Tax=Pseudarthrobacter sp. fls2-241-R2A-168 TaxID=3040304 RepID=UPI002555A653|nr:hypothetical protein [Pseudarthrobacter sp. fls2-241-R2A-168]